MDSVHDSHLDRLGRWVYGLTLLHRGFGPAFEMWKHQKGSSTRVEDRSTRFERILKRLAPWSRQEKRIPK
jgi:hypothetical protein